MRYLSFLLIVFAVVLNATQAYPSLFTQQAIPLYNAAVKFEKLQKYNSIKADVINYSKEAEKTKKIGQYAYASQDEKDIKEYLQALRKLQKKHDDIVKLSISELLKSIKKNNYKDFTFLADYGVGYFKDKDRLKNRILSYYKKNRFKKKIASLDRIIRNDRVTIKNDSQYIYTKINNSNSNNVARRKDIVVLTRPGCSWCKKVKALLDNSGKSYRELDARSGAGARLYRKYNGRGVPLTIVDGEVFRGYSKDSILQAIE